MDPWTLREAMLSMDATKLPLDTVHKLINFVPTAEEAQLLDGYEKEKNLGVAENFVKIVRTVDAQLVERLKLWEFEMEFDELYQKQVLNTKENAQNTVEALETLENVQESLRSLKISKNY